MLDTHTFIKIPGALPTDDLPDSLRCRSTGTSSRVLVPSPAVTCLVIVYCPAARRGA